MSHVLYVRYIPTCVRKIELRPLMAVICSWCPDKSEGHVWATRHEIPITDGICAGCRDRYFPAIAESDGAALVAHQPGEH